MGGAAVDVAFIITLEEQSYREEEDMRKESAERWRNTQANTKVISGDAKKGAGLFKVCTQPGSYLLSMRLTFGRPGASSATA
jgi:hypothetical protein